MASSCLPTIAQSERINQTDSDGTKQGVWIEYLDSTKWAVLPDAAHASFSRYTFYEDGLNLFQEFTFRRVRLVKADRVSQQNRSPLLNGEYQWYDHKKRLLEDNFYLNGERQWEKNYWWGFLRPGKTGKKLHEYYDWRRRYKDQPHTGYYEEYDQRGNVKIYYFRHGNKGWALYEE